MRKGTSIVALATLPLAALAQERGFDYTYVEGGYLSDAGPVEPDSDGLGLRGSVTLNDRLHLFADYSTHDHDAGPDLESSVLAVGVGFHTALRPRLDFVGEVGWASAEIDTSVGGEDDEGLALTAALRYRANDDLELEGSINHLDVDWSDTWVALRARYWLTRSFAVTGGLLFDEGDTGLQLGFRASFGR